MSGQGTELLLILDASEGYVRFLLVDECVARATHGQAALSGIVCAQYWDAPSRGTELLPPTLAEALQRLGRVPADIVRIACVHGPGSFTGLRLVLTFAAAVRRATGATVGALNFMQAIATEAWSPLLENAVGRLRIVTHARRGLVHIQDFSPPVDVYDGIPTPLTPPEQHPLENLFAGIGDTPTLFVGSGVTRNHSFVRDLLENTGTNARCTVIVARYDRPSSQSLLRLTLALPASAWQAYDLDPLYVRPCDAMDNLAHIATQRGQSPTEAHAQVEALLARAPDPTHFF